MGGMRRLFVLAALAAVAVFPGRALATGDCVPGAWGTLRPDLASAALQLINDHRTAMGEAALKISPRLQASADWKSLHMAFNNYFDHYDENYPTPGVNRDPFDRMATCGYSFNTYMGENIAYGFSSAASVVNGWLGSAGHRANIENGGF